MYSLISQLLDPFTLVSVCLAGAMLWAFRAQKPRSRGLVTAGLLTALLLAVATPLAGRLAQGTLEWPYPPVLFNPAPEDTLVVLSGGMVIEDDEGKQARLASDTLQRCYHAAKLYHRAGGCRLVLSGGKVDWSNPGPTLAAAMRDCLLELGVRPDDMILEEKSSTTYENVLYSKPLLETSGGGRIYLVTEAIHMFRSERCFRAQGVVVTPAPCDHHLGRQGTTLLTFIPASRGAMGVSRAAHEWLGCVWYWLRGRI